MKNYLGSAAGLIAAGLLLAAPAMAQVNVHVDIPGVYVPAPVYVQPRPVYIQPEYENDWRERQQRAIEWRDNPQNHGQHVSAAAHERNNQRKAYKKHHKNKKHDD